MTSGLPAGRAELAHALRQLRTTAGMSQAETGRRAGMPRSKLSRIESMIYLPSEHDLDALAAVYGASPAERDQLAGLLNAVRATNRRLVINRDPAALQARIGRIEKTCTHVATFQLGAVPGLLQTGDYMRAVYDPSPYSPQQTDEAIAGRLARQAAAATSTATRYTQIMTEGALTWQAVGPHVMTAQLDWISEAITWQSMSIGIIPAARPVDVFPLHGFDLYDDRSVMVGLWTASAMFDEPGDVAQYVSLFQRLQGLAVFGDDARGILARIADDYRNLEDAHE